MAEDIDVPKIGKIQKKYVYGAAAVAAAYVGWRYYQSSQAAASDVTTVTPDVNNPDVSASGVIGDAASGNVQYAGTTTSGNGILTNADWTADAVNKLTATGGWDAASVYSALGDYLAAKPLSDTEQSIVRAAIAASGNPPVGTFNVIPSTGDMTLPAPTGLKASSVTANSAVISWTAVPNAASYNLYRSDTGSTVIGQSGGSATSATLAGLQPNVSYSVSVAAVSTLGKVGTKSSPLTVKTAGVSLKAPPAPTLSGITKTTATVKTSAVAGATGYNWYINNVAHGHSDAPTYLFQGLKANTSYKATVAADNATQAPGPMSNSKTFKTAK